MSEITVARTLVKSPPEVWAAMSDVESLARHLDAFGEIRITRLEPETTVAWEGERASGTVEISASGWGTRVKLTAAVESEPVAETPPVEPSPPLAPDLQPVPDLDPLPDEQPGPERDPNPLPDPDPLPEPTPLPAFDPAPDDPPPAAVAQPPAPKRSLWARLFGRWDPVPEPEPAQPAAPAPEPEPVVIPEPVVVAAPVVVPEPEPVVIAVVEPEPVAEPEPAADAVDAEAVLAGILDDLGSAHHRPFSRG
jgi:hypothetical protein